MELEALIREASEDELRTLVGVMQRANAKPAVLVTTEYYGRKGPKRRRYVVNREDEHLFIGLDGPVNEEILQEHFGCAPWSVHFGGQWLRSFGKVDEMAASLGASEIVKVEHVDRKKVWGH